jgi:type II secretory pathway pseudopilin PulG
MKSSKFIVQRSRFFTFRIPHSAFRNSPGFTYIALIAAVAIIGISLGAAGKYWQNVMLRDKEKELLFRGDQYRQAIERYYFAIPGRPQYPESIDNLITDNRTAAGRRHLRQKYKDPMTNEDFVEIRDQLSRRITGVYSSSDKKPLKQDNFAEGYPEFAGKEKYSEWKFVSNLRSGQPLLPGRLPVPGHPMPAIPRQ